MNDGQLPLCAFRMSGENVYIELTVERVFDGLQDLFYGGGYFSRGTLTVRSGGYSAAGTHCFTTGELFGDEYGVIIV